MTIEPECCAILNHEAEHTIGSICLAAIGWGGCYSLYSGDSNHGSLKHGSIIVRGLGGDSSRVGRCASLLRDVDSYDPWRGCGRIEGAGKRQSGCRELAQVDSNVDNARWSLVDRDSGWFGNGQEHGARAQSTRTRCATLKRQEMRFQIANRGGKHLLGHSRS